MIGGMIGVFGGVVIGFLVGVTVGCGFGTGAVARRAFWLLVDGGCRNGCCGCVIGDVVGVIGGTVVGFLVGVTVGCGVGAGAVARRAFLAARRLLLGLPVAAAYVWLVSVLAVFWLVPTLGRLAWSSVWMFVGVF